MAIQVNSTQEGEHQSHTVVLCYYAVELAPWPLCRAELCLVLPVGEGNWELAPRVDIAEEHISDGIASLGPNSMEKV